MRTVYVRDVMRIPLGKQGENEAVQVVFPGIVEQFRGLYGDGAFTLTAKRCGDAEAYPVAVSINGGDLLWVVSAADVASPGNGSCELTYTVDGVIAKTQTWGTYTAVSISGDAPGEPPEEPAKAWFAAMQGQIGNLDNLTTKAKANLVAAINEAAKTGSGGAGSISMRTADGYIQYSTDDGDTWENLIALADLQGPQGDPGKDGTDGAPGKDGADGAPGKDGTDGTNGITPTIGDNGNWYLGTTDTGKPSRGPAGQDGKDGVPGKDGADGAPGKDGAGMDVTGATPGQIAKISAVDTDGKPTAWEPVDMPSGGEEAWEFIGEWTCAENAQTFLVDKDKNGNPFSMKEIAIITYSPAFTGDTTATGRGLGVFPNTAWGHGLVLMANAPQAKDNAIAIYELHYLKLYGDSMRLIERFKSQNAMNVRGALMLQTAADNAPIAFTLGNADDPFELKNTQFTGPATCIKLAGYANTAVSAGTKIKAWGVKA